MRYLQLTLLSVLATVPLAVLATPLAPPWNDVLVKHAWNTVPADWESLGPPPAGTVINLHVALKPRNENALIDALYEVSTPSHPKYGAHLSKEEVARLVAPHQDTLELIRSWFAHHGVPSSSISTSLGGGWLTLVGVPVSQANEMLGASYQLYRPAGTNDSTILRTVGYSLPVVLHTHVQTVAPTTYFGAMRTPSQTPSIRAKAALADVRSREPVTAMSSRNEPEAVTPEVLRWLYKTFAYVPAATDRNVLGIAGYNGEYPSPQDLGWFMSGFRADARDPAFTVEKVNGGGYDPSQPGIEANLDMQYTQAMAYPTPHVYYSTGGSMHWTPPSNEPASDDLLLTWLNYMLDKEYIPQTISTSNGVDEKRLPLEYATAVCTLFAHLGARGISVLYGSGDYGVGRGDCKTNDGSGRVQFIPTFPATCPWVTSVGGTTRILPEVAASLSGGGFSNYFQRPDYQNDDVNAFLRRLGRKYDGMYTPSGRGIPDISAQAVEYMIVVNTNVFPVSGTSCSTPTAAGIISLLNDFLISEGKNPLGFLNPWLYGGGFRGLNDIRSGSNPGCNTDGFTAIAGWDPVTGLGTPDFFELQHILFNERILGNPEQLNRTKIIGTTKKSKKKT
ncbi:subtilisin-like protein [Lactarius pseudohatsudake]|nr:subtilisin-like protein [Lactarius pseudohatsudake]